MNVTMPAPAPTATPAAPPSDRIAPRERTSTTPSERRTDDERTFEEQLDEVAVALGSTPRQDPIEARTKPHTTSGPSATVSTAFAAPLASTTPTPPATAGTAGDTPGDTAVAAPPVAIAAPVVTEIEGPHALLVAAPTTQALSAPATSTDGTPPSTADVPTPATTEPTPTATVPTTTTTDTPAPATTEPTPATTLPTAPTEPVTVTTEPTATATLPTTTDTPAPATTDPTATANLPTTTTEPGTTSDANATPLPTLTTPANTGPIATAATSVGGADPAPHQTSLGAASKLALDATSDDVDAPIDAKIDITGIDSADGADTTTPPVLVNQASSLRRDDAPARVAGGPAPLITDAADDLAPPIRLAPPRTIAVDLNDEGLGPLRVVATTEQRTVHLAVSAGEAIVRDALVRQQADLRNDLADAGLQLGSFEVDARAADRDHTDQPTATSDSDRDRQTARSAAGRAAATPIHDTHESDGHLDLRL